MGDDEFRNHEHDDEHGRQERREHRDRTLPATDDRDERDGAGGQTAWRG